MPRVLTRLLCVAAFVFAANARAESQVVSLGGDLSLLMREEGAGNRTAMFAIGPRALFRVHRNFGLVAGYRFSYHEEGTVLRAANQFHRLMGLGEARLPIGATTLTLGLGPVASLSTSVLRDVNDGTEIRSNTLRPGYIVSTGVEVELSRVRWRASAEYTSVAQRNDLYFGVGAMFMLGGEG